MRQYRVFQLKDGRIVKASLFLTCETDREAITKAQQLAAGLDFEIWEGSRRRRATNRT
jgi:hypothetical protein